MMIFSTVHAGSKKIVCCNKLIKTLARSPVDDYETIVLIYSRLLLFLLSLYRVDSFLTFPSENI